MDESATDDDLVALLRGTVHAHHPDERITITPLVCPACGWNRFEVVADECFCEGCCLPLGVEDGGVHPNGYPWRLTPAHPDPSPVFACPDGHDLFEAALALTTTPRDEPRRLSLALRCTDDGTGFLHIDNATITPRPCPCPPGSHIQTPPADPGL
ncbi:hypothetical protein ABZ615_32595 [Streptomyces sp. NPDC007325]|uniref:hypothetical protein n=1 Tax=Streptomyces sp. NPDC007325 TaxID=3154588 RepID=UPI0033FD9C82